LFFAVELLEDRNSRQPFDPELQLNSRIRDRALQNGLAIYPGGGTIDGVRGDHFIVAPPYICEPRHIDAIVEKLDITLRQALEDVRPAANAAPKFSRWIALPPV
jgi:adenosylmethionine-8-amino-7-oxononanoate aminotransferase